MWCYNKVWTLGGATQQGIRTMCCKWSNLTGLRLLLIFGQLDSIRICENYSQLVLLYKNNPPPQAIQ